MPSAPPSSTGRAACVIALVLGLAQVALADQDDDDDDGGFDAHVEELAVVELAVPQEAWEVQVTLAGAFDTAAALDRLELGLELELGLTDWLQISAGAPVVGLWPAPPADDAVGVGDVELGALGALGIGAGLVLALAVEARLPTGDADRGLGGGETIIEPSLRAAVELDPVQGHALVGLGLGDEVEVEFGAGLTTVVGDAWVIILEAAFEAEDDGLAGRVVPGFAWSGLDDAELGAGAVLFVGGDGPDWGATARAAVEF